MNRLIASRGLLQIFFSLLLVIVIMSVSNYVVYRNSISGIYEKVTQNNRLAVKNIIQAFDSSLTTVNNLIFTIHGLPYDRLKSGGSSTLDMSQVYSLQDNLASLVSSVDYIEDVVVFYDQVDLAITASGTSDMKLLFQNKYRHDMYNAAYWRNFAKSKRPFTVFPASDFYAQAEGSKPRSERLMVVMDGNKYKLSDKNVMVLINVEKWLQHVNLQAMVPGSSLIVLDADRNVILSTDKNLDLVEVLNDVYFKQPQGKSLTRGDFEYSFYQSDYNGFIYIDKMPYQFQNIDSVASGSRLIMIVAIVSAVVLAGLLSVYLYLPVKGILKLLGGGRVKGNDFRKIHSGIAKAQRENEELRRQIQSADAELCRAVFLQSLLEGRHAGDDGAQARRFERSLFREKQFVMALFQFKSKEETGENAGLNPEDMAEEIRGGLQNVAGHAAVFHVQDLRFAALIGIVPGAGRKEIIDGVRSFMLHAGQGVFAGFTVRACVSKTYESRLQQCRPAYQDLLNGLRYRNTHDEAQAVIDTESIRYVADVYFPLEKMDKLTRCLTGGRTEEAVHIVRDIISENAARNIHHYHLAHVAKSIFLYIIKPVEASVSDDKELLRLEARFIRQVDEAFGHDEIGNALAELVQSIADKRSREPKSKLNPAFISQYIELNYMHNLYLDRMAEVLDTTPKYFSNYFKKTFGINYVEYLNKVRLEHAREFLKNTDFNIAEIGEKTGYANASTFTTTFKKYYGISPSEYRKTAGEG